ncbi:MAG: LamG-like jellyroll fold domain-containing protein [Synechococcales bacterium]|nr:LamG-like jellyroll fold domain-containing protein [Synechococcales bacterium]
MSTLKLLPALESLKAFQETHPDFSTVGQILALSETAFVDRFADDAFGGDSRQARRAYREAQRIQELTTLLWVNLKDTVGSPYTQATLFNTVPDTFLDHQGLIPGYDRLFGSLDFIECDHCRSIFGPAAYFVDLLRFIETHIPQDQIQDDTGRLSGHRLVDRQPRIFRLPLSCENTFDLVPYINLVNEVLEDVVRTAQSPDPYALLAEAEFPQSLPFHLPLAEIRLYLEQLKLRLENIYRLFGVRKPAIAQEILELSPQEATLLGQEVTTEAALNRRYGVDDVLATGQGSLEDVAVFLEQTGLTRPELDKLLYLDLSEAEVQVGLLRLSFINATGDGQGALTIEATTDPTTGKSYDRLVNLTLPKLDRIYRFLKLARKLEWSFADLDWALRSLTPAYPAEAVLQFDGINDFVEIPNTGDLRLTDGSTTTEPALTLEAWVWLDSVGHHPIIAQGDPDGSPAQYLLWITPTGRLSFYSYFEGDPQATLADSGDRAIDDRGNLPPRTSDGSLPPNAPGINLTSAGQVPLQRFTHIAVTVNEPSTGVAGHYHTRFYINGVLDTTWSLKVSIPLDGSSTDPATAILYLGTYHNQDFLAGSLSEVRLWNRIRSGAELQRDRLTRLRGTENGLLAYWPLVDRPDGILTDYRVGNAHPGYLGGVSHSALPRWIQRDLVLTPLPTAIADTALRFNGRDDYLATDAFPAVDLHTFTLEARVRITGTGAQGLITLGNAARDGLQNDSLQIGWSLEPDGDNWRSVLQSANITTELRSDFIAQTEVEAGVHLAVVVELLPATAPQSDRQVKASFFVNGAAHSEIQGTWTPRPSLGDRDAIPPAFPSQGGDLYLGRGFGDRTYLQGTLQEVRIWRISRSQTELQQTLHQQLTGAEAGLIGYWRLDTLATDGLLPDLSFSHAALTAGGILAIYQPQARTYPEVLLPAPLAQSDRVLQFDAQHYVVTVVNAQAKGQVAGLGHHEQLTLELWVWAEEATRRDRKQVLLTQGDAETGLSLYLFEGSLYAHAWCYHFDGTPISQETLVSNNFPSQQWNQITWVYDEITSTEGVYYGLYVNGTLAAETPTGFRLDQVGPMHLGGLTPEVMTRFHDGESLGSAHYLAGQLTDLRLWRVALSATTITSPLADRHPRHIPPAPSPDLLCYLPLMEGYGAPVGNHAGLRYAPSSDDPTLLTPVIYDQTPQAQDGHLVVGPDPVPPKWADTPLPPIYPDTALTLNGGSLWLPDTATLGLVNSAFTLELWVKVDSSESPAIDPAVAEPVVESAMALLRGGPQIALTLEPATGILQAQLGSQSLTAAVPLEAGQWHHIAWRFDPEPPATQTLFIDGEEQGTQPNSSALIETVQLVLGEGFRGHLSELRIWNLAHTEGAIATQAQRRLSGTEAGLQGYWVFDGDPAQRWIDAVAGHTAQLDSLTDPLPAAAWVAVETAFPRQEWGLSLNQDAAVLEVIELPTLAIPPQGTLEIWGQFNRNQPQTFLDASTPTASFRLSLAADQTLRFAVTNGAGETAIAELNLAPLPLALDDTVQSIVATWDVSTTTVLSLSLGDSLVFAQAAGSGLPPLATTSVGLAKSSESPMTGRLHQLRLWDHVRALYTLQAARRADLHGDEPGLLVYLPLDETTGTRLNAPGLSPTIAFAKALPIPQTTPQWVEADWAIVFRGNNQINRPDNVLSQNQGDYIDFAPYVPGQQGTIALWVKFDPNREQVILDASNDTGANNREDKYFVLEVYRRSPRSIALRFRIEEVEDINLIATIPLENLADDFDQHWHLIRCTWQYNPQEPSVVGQLYLDADRVAPLEQEGRASLSGRVPEFLSLFFGKNRGTYQVVANNPFRGELRQLQVWDRVLTEAELTALTEITQEPTTGLILDLPIDTGRGTQLRNTATPPTDGFPSTFTLMRVPEIGAAPAGEIAAGEIAAGDRFWILLDYAVQLNGTDQFIGLPEPLPWPSGSLGLWLRFTVSEDSGPQILLDASGNDATPFFVLDLLNTQLRFWLDDVATGIQIDLSNLAHTSPRWHYLFATWQIEANTATLQLAFDDRPLVTTEIIHLPDTLATRNPYIGMRRGEADALADYQAFAGEIRQMDLWSTIQSLADVRRSQLYSLDARGPAVDLSLSRVTSLPIEAGSGTELDNGDGAAPAQLYTRLLARPQWQRIPGRLWQFDQSYAVLPTLPDLGITDGDFTLEGWVRLPDLAGSQPILGTRGPIDPASPEIFALTIVNGTPQVQIQGQNLTASDLSLSPNQWHQVALRYQQGVLSLWLDGTASATTLMALPPLTAQRHLYVAHWRLATAAGSWEDAALIGQIDELRIWAVALTDIALQSASPLRLAADTPGLSALWRFDEAQRWTVRDRSPRRHHRNLLGTAETIQFAPAQPPIALHTQVLALDGYNDYLDLGNPTLAGSTAWTLAFWYRCAQTDGTQVLVSQANRFQASVVDGCFQMEWQEAGTRAWEEAFFVTPEIWHQVALVNDGTHLQIVHDGVAVGEARPATLPPDQGTPLWLGTDADLQPDRYFQGHLAQVELWNLARPVEAIAATRLHPLSGREPGLLAYWPIEEAPGAVLYDQTEAWPAAQLIAGLENTAEKWQAPPPPIATALSALVLDGRDDHIFLGDLAQFSLEEGFVVAVWLRLSSTADRGAVLGSSIGQTQANGLCLGVGDRRPTLQLADLVVQADTALDDQWHYLVWHYDAGTHTVQIWQDGTVIASGTATLTLPSDAMAYLGRWQTWDADMQQGVDHFFPGRIGEVSLWQGIRPSEAITAPRLQRLVGNEPGLLAYWIFDDAHEVRIPAQIGRGDYYLLLRSTLTLQPPLWQTIDTHPIWRTPLLQTALNFDGERQFLALEGFTPSPDSFTIEAWINNLQVQGESRPRQETPILWRGQQTSDDWETDFELRVNQNGQLTFYYRPAADADSDRLASLVAPNSFPVNQFIHVAVTVADADETTLRLWVNGETVATITQPASPRNGGPVLKLGWGNGAGPVAFFRGLMQEVRLWSTARSEAELRAEMHRPLADPVRQPALIGYWPLVTLQAGRFTPDRSAGNRPFRLGGLESSRRPDVVTLVQREPGFLDPGQSVLTLSDSTALPGELPIPPFNATVGPNRQQRTIEVWFRSENPLLTRSQVIYREGDADQGLSITLEAGVLIFRGYNRSVEVSAWDNSITTDRVRARRWHHAVLVLNGRADVQDNGFCALLDGQMIGSLPGAQLGGAIAPIAIGGIAFTPRIEPAATDIPATATAVQKTGNWHTTAAGYLHDRGKLKGAKSLTFPISQPSGTYRLFLHYPTDNPLAPAQANNVPVTVTHGAGTTSLTLDLRQGGGDRPIELGVFELASGTPQVVLETTNTAGLVIVEKLRLVPLHYQQPAPPPTPLTTAIQTEDDWLDGQIKEVRIWEAVRLRDDLWQTRHDISTVDAALRQHLLFHWETQSLPADSPAVQPLRLTERPSYRGMAATLSWPDLAAIVTLQRDTDLPLERLAVLWSSLRYFGNGDDLTLFDTLFNPRGTADSNRWNYFPSEPRRWQVSSTDPDQRAIRSRLMAAFRVSQADLNRMVAAVAGVENVTELEAVDLDGDTLTQLYRLALLTQVLDLSVPDVLILMARLQQEVGLNPLANLTLVDIAQLRERVTWMQESGIDLTEYEFLVANQPDRRIAPPYNDGSLVDIATDVLAQVQPILLSPTTLVSQDPIISEGVARAVYDDLLRPTDGEAQAEEVTLTLPISDGEGLQITLAVLSPRFDQYDNRQVILTALGYDSLADQADREALAALASSITEAVTDRLRGLHRDLDTSLTNALATLLDTSADRLEAIFDRTEGNFYGNSQLKSAALLRVLNEMAVSRVVERQSDSVKDLLADLDRLYKILFFLSQFDLTTEELETLLETPAIFGLADDRLLTPQFADLERLYRFGQLKTRLRDPGNRLLELIQVKTETAEAIAALTGWPASEIRTLATGLGINDPADYTTLAVLDQLHQGFRFLTALGTDAASLLELAKLPNADFAAYRRQAVTLQNLLRARYTEDQWPQVWTPIHDRLATQQRDSLTAYALESLGDRISGRKSPDLLYEYLLIDVQTSSAVQTSRIVQAIAALQLYVQRCLMNLERGVDPNRIPQNEWLWMKNYRVWEANRKVFLYPENYIEPELRDTKTPLFADLESELQQSDVNKDTVAAAYTRYLDRFAEVANLTIVGSYLDTPELNLDGSAERDATLYLVGRNEATQEYYLRSRVQKGEVAEWKPWEKIDVSINAKFVSPVVAFNKLFLFWAELQENFVTEDRIWINRSRNSSGTYDRPYDQLGNFIELQSNTDVNDNRLDTVNSDVIITDTDINSAENRTLRERFNQLVQLRRQGETIADRDKLNFPTVDDGGNSVLSLTYRVNYTFSERYFIFLVPFTRVVSGSQTITLDSNAVSPIAPAGNWSNYSYEIISFRKRRTLFPADTYNELDGGFINIQTHVINDKHGVIQQVNRPVSKPIIKYTYYNFSRTWVQPQTYAQLEVQLNEWRQRQPKWQRVYAQRWRESFSGPPQSRSPEPIDDLRVFQVEGAATLVRQIPSGFSPQTLTLSFWLRVNPFGEFMFADVDRPADPGSFQLFQYGTGSNILRGVLARPVEAIGEEPQIYQTVNHSQNGLADVNKAITALQTFKGNTSTANRNALAQAFQTINPDVASTTIAQARQAGDRLTDSSPGDQLATAVVASADAARTAISSLVQNPPAAAPAQRGVTVINALVTVGEQAIAAAAAARLVLAAIPGTNIPDNLVPESARTALAAVRTAASNARTYAAYDLTAPGTVQALIAAGRLEAPERNEPAPTEQQIRDAINNAVDEFITTALSNTQTVLTNVQPILSQTKDVKAQTPKWQLALPRLQLTLGNSTQSMQPFALPSQGQNDVWRHIALVLQYQSQSNPNGYRVTTHVHTADPTNNNPRSETFFLATSSLPAGARLRLGATNNPDNNFSGNNANQVPSVQPWMSEFRWWNEARSQPTIGQERFFQQNGDTDRLIHIPLDRSGSSEDALLLVSDREPNLGLQRTFATVVLSQSRERLLLLYGDVPVTSGQETDGLIRTFRSNAVDQRFNFFLRPNSQNYEDLSLSDANTPFIGLEGRPGLSAENYAENRVYSLERYAPGDRQRIQQVAGLLPLPTDIDNARTAFADNASNSDVLLRDSVNDNRLIDPVETSVLDVHNQPGWYVLDIGDSQFLVTVAGSNNAVPQTAEQRLEYVNPSRISNTAAVDVGLRYTIDRALANPSALHFARLNTFAVQSLSDRLFAEGIDGLLSLASQSLPEPDFDSLTGNNATNITIQGPNDGNIIDFEGSYGIYYWEIFFHIPFLIANQLNANQNFEAAQNWYHYIFNPTTPEVDKNGVADPGNTRYWRFRPFRGEPIETLVQILTNQNALRAYREDPFDPHAIARLRINAYQKAVVMKYIDNLLDWGDTLFRQDTRESINEAILLYVLAFNLLGPRPRIRQTRPFETVGTYEDVQADLARAQIPDLPDFLANATDPGIPPNLQIPFNPHRTVSTRFCTPENEQFVGYWDRVEDRLYKIRHSLNIDGVFRSLALFQPPIDPAALVNAVAGGGLAGALASGVGASSQPVPHYRYSFMLNTAKEMASTVMGLGSALLDALEKKDAEALALLQQTHEAALLDLTTDIKQMQIRAAETSLSALETGLASAEFRRNWYQTRIDDNLSQKERDQINLIISSTVIKTTASVMEFGASFSSAIPQITVGGSGAFGSPVATVETGGDDFADVFSKAAAALKIVSEVLSDSANIVGMKASYERRKAEWEQQRDLAVFEITQIQSQIAEAALQIQIAQRELEIHQRTIEQHREVGAFYRQKFTNEELYTWMSSRLSGLYFQTYKLAYDLAKQAERAYQFEFGATDTYISFGHWDSRRRGLLAGEALLLDLGRLEKSALDQDSRYLEITKPISLLRLDPLAFLDLKTTGRCQFKLDELLFDRDFPGHYFRIIKAVSLSIPAVVGPYQTVKATLTQTGHQTLLAPDLGGVQYLLGETNGTIPGSIRADWRANQQIALSTGVDDSGVFELNFNDDRYLPFEGTGAVSSWLLEMPLSTNAIDFDTISDVVINLRYMCKTDGGQFRQQVMNLNAVKAYQGSRLFSIAHEFAAQWHAFKNDDLEVDTLPLPLPPNAFPPNVEVDMDTVVIRHVFAADAEGNLEEVTDQFADLPLALAPGTSASSFNLTATADFDKAAAENLWILVTYEGQLRGS